MNNALTYGAPGGDHHPFRITVTTMPAIVASKVSAATVIVHFATLDGLVLPVVIRESTPSILVASWPGLRVHGHQDVERLLRAPVLDRKARSVLSSTISRAASSICSWFSRSVRPISAW